MTSSRSPLQGAKRTVRLHVEQLESRELLDVTPLNDLGPGLYQGVMGGLYPNGTNTRPVAHEAAGLNIAQNQVVPRNAAGLPDPVNGRIAMISVGMSNTTREFSGTAQAFQPRADRDASKNPQLVIVDGAQGGQAADAWVNPNAPTWNTVDQRLTARGVSRLQVQVAWVKQADRQPLRFGAFPYHTFNLYVELAQITRNLLTRYPNIKLAYFSSRTHAYTSVPTALNPEPFAFESGFSVKWLLETQTAGLDLNYDPARGPVTAPYLSWGPYLWADGTNPRSDGFTWDPDDVVADQTHPSPSGIRKVADQLLAFFKTDPTATPWFLRREVIGEAPYVLSGAFPNTGAAPLGVVFVAFGYDPDGEVTEYVWTFDDGTFAYGPYPIKVFPAPGTYNAHVTVTDDAGNAVTQTVTVTVGSSAPGGAPGAGDDGARLRQDLSRPPERPFRWEDRSAQPVTLPDTRKDARAMLLPVPRTEDVAARERQEAAAVLAALWWREDLLGLDWAEKPLLSSVENLGYAGS